MCSCRSTEPSLYIFRIHDGKASYTSKYTDIHHRHIMCNVVLELELLYCVVFRSALVSQAHCSCRPPSEIVRTPRVRLLLHLDHLQSQWSLKRRVRMSPCCRHRHLYSITLAGVKLAGVLQLLGDSL